MKNDLKRLESDNSQFNYMRDRIQSTHVERVNRPEQRPMNNENIVRTDHRASTNL